MTETEITCMECGKKFKRDITLPKWQKIYAAMGAVADQCDICLRQMTREQLKE